MKKCGETIVIKHKYVVFIKFAGDVENGGGHLRKAKRGEPGAIMVSAANCRRDLMRLLARQPA